MSVRMVVVSLSSGHVTSGMYKLTADLLNIMFSAVYDAASNYSAFSRISAFPSKRTGPHLQVWGAIFNLAHLKSAKTLSEPWYRQ